MLTGDTRLPDPYTPPVQPVTQNDTLGTGQSVPSYPVPQPVPATTELTYEQVMTPEELALNNRLPYAERATTLYSPSQIKQIKADGRWENWLADARRLTGPVQVAQPNQTTTQPVANPPSTTQPSRSAGFDQSDQRWIASLPAELQVQVLRLNARQVDAYKARGEWTRFQTIVTQAAGEMRNAEIEEQREKLAIWERAWSQSQRVLIEGSLWLIPVERIAVAAYDMSKVVRGARIVAETPRGVGATGIIGERFLQTLGGRSQVGFQTTRGMRYVDQVVGRAGHESKVGYQSLSGDIPEQIAKDQLLLVRDLDAITWHFFRSPTTGQIGPSGPLREALRKAGIEIIEHPNP